MRGTWPSWLIIVPRHKITQISKFKEKSIVLQILLKKNMTIKVYWRA